MTLLRVEPTFDLLRSDELFNRESGDRHWWPVTLNAKLFLPQAIVEARRARQAPQTTPGASQNRAPKLNPSDGRNPSSGYAIDDGPNP